jgi:hypothetical protein
VKCGSGVGGQHHVAQQRLLRMIQIGGRCAQKEAILWTYITTLVKGGGTLEGNTVQASRGHAFAENAAPRRCKDNGDCVSGRAETLRAATD